MKNIIMEEEYREAAIIWRKENPALISISQKTIVKIKNGKEINLGTRMSRMRAHIDKLTEEQKGFWKEYGLYDGKPTEEEFREAAMIWRTENPTAKSIPLKTVVTIGNGREIHLGKRMGNMRTRIDKLTEEQKGFWKEYGLYDGKPTEEEYREAAMIWRKENPTAKSIPRKAKFTIKNGKEINLGTRMNTMRRNTNTLTEEQKEFWKAYGLYEKNKRGRKKEQKSKQSKVQDRIVSIALQISKKYTIPFSNLLFMYETLREYEQLDVGLEDDYEKKIQKIKEYHFDEMDVEESYFLALSFKQSVLEKKQKEWWQRNELLRQYILDWNYYSEEEKKEETKIQNFTPEELEFINRSREEMDALLHSLKM